MTIRDHAVEASHHQAYAEPLRATVRQRKRNLVEERTSAVQTPETVMESG